MLITKSWIRNTLAVAAAVTCLAIVRGDDPPRAKFDTDAKTGTDATAAPTKSATPPTDDWRNDPMGRLVFFAVLEGLYEDNVSDDVVNSILPLPKTGAPDPEQQMKHSFVLGCPLCRPAYEAFRSYQARPREIAPLTSESDRGISPEERENLLRPEVMPRVNTLRQPILRWVERRLVAMKVTPDEQQAWMEKVSAGVQTGREQLQANQKIDESYKNWSGYWGCAACLGSQDAVRHVKPVTP